MAFRYKFQTRLIYAPARSLICTPAVYGWAFQEFTLAVKDAQVHGWYLPAASLKHPVVIYCHGKSGNISSHVPLADFWRRTGCGCVLFDYRGYGQSQGNPSENGLYSDAEAVWAYLMALQIDPARIIIHGHSLGAAVAGALAHDHPECGGLILEGAFTSIPAIARRSLLWRILSNGYFLRDRFDLAQRMPKIRVPTVIIHGTRDGVVPFAMAQELFALAVDPKYLVPVVGVGHERLWSFLGTQGAKELLDRLHK